MRRTSGISLMLLIFLSLCLIIFSLLSVSGAVADQTLSRQAADRTTEYYAAVTSANELLSRIDGCLAAYLREAADGAAADAGDAPTTQENADTADAGATSTTQENADAAGAGDAPATQENADTADAGATSTTQENADAAGAGDAPTTQENADAAGAGAESTTQKNANTADAGAESAYLRLCSRISGDIPEASWEDGRITFSVDISEDQILLAELEVSWPVTDETALYQIRTWKVVNTAEWTADNSMNLFRLGDSDSG